MGTAADDATFRRHRHIDYVVGHQAVPPGDQVQGEFALAHAAGPDDEHAQSEHFHQNAVDRAHLGERFLEVPAEF